MKKSLFARLFGALIVMVILAVGVAPAATANVSAAPRVASVAVSVPMVPDAGGGSGNPPTSSCGTEGIGGNQGASSQLLPVTRWTSATAMLHSRLDNFMMADSGKIMARDMVINNGMSLGNFMWSSATQLSAFAINFCILDKMGGAADKVGATIGGAVLNSGLLVAITVISVVMVLFQARRRGGAAFRTLVSKGALIGLLAVMVAGSMNSKGGGMDGSNATYVPGVGSPGWVVTTLNKTVSSLASAPATALAMNTQKLPENDLGNALNCKNYVTSLNKKYLSSYGSGPDKLAAGVPLIMSGIWEKTGLQTWRMAQFGTATYNNSRLDEHAYCHLLDWKAGVQVMGSSLDADKLPSATTVRAVMMHHWPNFSDDETGFYNSKAWQPSNNVNVDRSIIAWSACALKPGADPTKESSWNLQPGFNADTEKKVTPSVCQKWFNTVGEDAPGELDWTSNGDDAKKRASTQALGDYILTIHGNQNSQGMTAVIAYNISALAMLIVFGMVSISIIVAKVAMIVMIISAFFLVLMSLLPSGGTDKLTGYVKMILGMNIFIFGVQMIFALIASLTQMLQSVGGSILGGDGSIMATLWAGGAPLIAVYMLHMMFTKVMKVPSPFAPSAGMAWGASAAAIGGATAAGVGSFLDRKARAQGAKAMGNMKRVSARGLNGAMSAASGGRLGGGTARRGTANPAATAAGKNGKRGAVSPDAVPAALSGKARRRQGTPRCSPGPAGLRGRRGRRSCRWRRRSGRILRIGAPARARSRRTVQARPWSRTSSRTESPQRPARHQARQPRVQPALLRVAEVAHRPPDRRRKTHGPTASWTTGTSSTPTSPTPTSPRAGCSGPTGRHSRAQRPKNGTLAAKHEVQRRKDLGLAPVPTRKRDKLRAAVDDTMYEVGQEFKRKPFKTTGKVLGVTAVSVMAAPALPLVPLLAPVGVGIGAIAARTAGRSVASKMPAARRAVHDNRVAILRQDLRVRMKEESKDRPRPRKTRASTRSARTALAAGTVTRVFENDAFTVGSEATTSGGQNNERPQAPTHQPATAQMPVV